MSCGYPEYREYIVLQRVLQKRECMSILTKDSSIFGISFK
jgi:hypothetical protein